MWDKNARNLEKLFKGLANKRRMKILRVLSKKRELSVSDISGEIKLSFKSTSKHLNILYKADILDRKQKGLVMTYFVAKDMPNFVKNIVLAISNSRE